MNHFKLIFLTFSLATLANGFPQSLSDVAVAVKQTDLNYYHSDAPDLQPYDNPQNIDNAKDEFEGYGSKVYSIYDGLQKKTSDVFQPKAVVDTIKSESEIYGNTGDNLKPLQNVVIGVMSVVSDIVNKIVDAPGNIFASVTTSLNKGLNGIGAKLVGLQ